MDPSISYRHIKPGEETAVCDMIMRGFNAFIAPGYSQRGVREFRQYVQPTLLAQRLQARHFLLVAATQTQIVGMIEVRDNNHVSLFFVDPAFQRRGVGRALMQRALALCKTNALDTDVIDVHASPYSVPVYQKLGFHRDGPEQERHGIRFIPMSLEI